VNSREETKHFYNTIAELSFKDWFNNPSLLPTLTIFISHLPKKPLVLDLGCGTGGESKRLSELGARVIGVDFSEESLKYAKKNIPDCEFINMDILEIKFPNNHFDGILEAGVLFHFTETEQDNILHNLYSMLKSGSRFISYYPHGNFEGMQEMDIVGTRLKRYSRLLLVQDWIQQVIKIGFNSYIEHDFNIGKFKCVEFIK
jgi:SAM-dependent methyltransferase